MTGRVLFFGSYDASLHPRVAVLRDGLAANGWEVEELNVPLGASTADKVAAAGSARSAATLAGKQLRSWRGLVAQARAQRPDPDVVVVGYLASFWFLTRCLQAGMPLGIAYGIWGALGVIATALASAALFGEPLTALMGVGIALVIAGVLTVELGSQRAHEREIVA